MSTNLLAEYCKNNLDLRSAKLGDEFYYSALPLAVLDSVFSIRLQYSTVQKIVENYCTAYGLDLYSFDRRNKQAHTITDFIANINAVGVEVFAKKILKSAHRTAGHTATTILKAEAAYEWGKILQDSKIETFADVDKLNDDYITYRLKSVQGQGGGVSVSYFMMLCGDDDFCKADTHLLNFLGSALERKIKPTEAQELLTNAVAILKAEYPTITIRLLDYTIWKYQSGKA